MILVLPIDAIVTSRRFRVEFFSRSTKFTRGVGLRVLVLVLAGGAGSAREIIGESTHETTSFSQSLVTGGAGRGAGGAGRKSGGAVSSGTVGGGGVGVRAGDGVALGLTGGSNRAGFTVGAVGALCIGGQTGLRRIFAGRTSSRAL